MNPLQAPTFTDIAIASGVGTAIALTVFGLIIWAFRSYFGSYLSKKAENLATKQDIQDLTRLQEEVKAEFDEFRERQRTEAQLRLAVVERRFQAHQEAHTLWLKIVHNVYGEHHVEVVMECQTWWQNNGLYLDQDARGAFIQATNAAFDHPNLLKGPRDEEHTKLIKDNWQTITKAGSIIEAAVNLPSLDVFDIQKPGKPKPTALGDTP